MIHILLSSWARLLLICLAWSHFPRLANSARHPDQDFFFFLGHFLHQCCTLLISCSVMSAQFKSVTALHAEQMRHKFTSIFYCKKDRECSYKSILYEGLYWKVMHMWSYPTGSERRNKEWLNNIEVIVGHLQKEPQASYFKQGMTKWHLLQCAPKLCSMRTGYTGM